MGGINQKTVGGAATQTPSVAGSHASTQTSQTRIHESNGEVHLHDDTNQRKVAVPVTNFHNKWKSFRNNPNADPLIFSDPTNGNQATLSWVQNIDDNGDPYLDISIDIQPIQFGNTFNQIDDFVNGR